MVVLARQAKRGKSIGVRRKRLWRQRDPRCGPCSLTFHRKDEVPHTDAPIAPPESEMAGVLAGSEFWIIFLWKKVVLPAFTEKKQRLALPGCSRVG